MQLSILKIVYIENNKNIIDKDKYINFKKMYYYLKT